MRVKTIAVISLTLLLFALLAHLAFYFQPKEFSVIQGQAEGQVHKIIAGYIDGELPSIVLCPTNFTWTTNTIVSAANELGSRAIVNVGYNTIFVVFHHLANLDLGFAKSTDAGDTWTVTYPVASGNRGRFPSIDAIDEDTIYISHMLTSTFFYLQYSKSVNGGTSWTTATVDAAAISGTGGENSITVVDANTAYIFYDTGGAMKMATTTNGGSSWAISTVLSATTSTMSAYAVDANTIFIVFCSPTDNDITLAKTTNAGGSWTFTDIDVVTGGCPSSTPSHWSLTVLDENNLIVSYYDTDPDDLRFAKSTNGGTSWTTSAVDTSGDVGINNSISFADSDNFFIGYHDTGTQNVEFARSIDVGTSWTTQIIDATNDDVISLTKTSPDFNTVYGVYGGVGTQNYLKFIKSSCP